MIGYADIKSSVLLKLKQKFPDINRPATDIESGFPRPAFFIQLLPIGENDFNDYSEMLLTVNIQYFSKEKTEAANLEMADNLRKAFKILNVSERFLEVKEKRFLIQDNVLQYKFDLNFTDGAYLVEVNGEYVEELDESLGYDEDTVKLMEELEIDESEVK
jgi:hypothetical protein